MSLIIIPSITIGHFALVGLYFRISGGVGSFETGRGGGASPVTLKCTATYRKEQLLREIYTRARNLPL
jgi:hypothetical protein